MSKLQGYATAVNQTQEIVCAYASAPYEPVPASSNAPWVVFGSFRVPITVSARLSVLGFNTGPAVLSVAVFGPALVTNSETLVTMTTEGETVSQPFDLVPGVTYQVAVKYAGASGIGMIRTFSLAEK